ncbi:hypothetical protein AX16_007619 [Volvariella volvacea WC 439]|nr:hypothetical protein AX16_007619 [Volvariella volvacea WC 439]
MRVAELLPDNELHRLRGVSKAFLEISYQQKYRKLHLRLDFWDSEDLILDLVRIRRLGVSRCVRNLFLSPIALWRALHWPLIESVGLEWEVETQDNDTSPQGNVIARECDPELLAERNKITTLSEDERVELLMDVLGSLDGLKDLSIYWPKRSEMPIVDLGKRTPTLHQMCARLPLSNLQSLTLDMAWKEMEAFLSSSGQLEGSQWFHSVRYLRLKPVFYFDTKEHEADDFLALNLPRFVHTLGPGLRSLVIEPLGHYEFSLMLEKITVPYLEDVAIRLPLDPCHTSRPECIASFIRRHAATLQQIEFMDRRCCNSGGPDLVFEWYGKWLAELVRLQQGVDVPVSNVERLNWDVDIRSISSMPPLTPEGSERMLRIMLWHELAKGFPNVKSLQVSIWSMKLEEVRDMLLPAFVESEQRVWELEELSIYARLMSPELIILLATYCGGLRKLRIQVDEYAEDEEQREDTYGRNTVTDERVVGWTYYRTPAFVVLKKHY